MKPYKIEAQIMYTETTFYDGAGNEIASERMFDDHLWDDSGPLPLTQDDMENYFPEEETP